MRLYVLVAAAVYYLTKVLLFEEKTSHFGPFASKSKWVIRQNTHYQQPVTLFDRIRRWSPFNPYDVSNLSDGESLWHVNEPRMERWTCPKCLSFWISLAVNLFMLIFIDRPHSFKDLAEKLIAVVAMAGVTTYLAGHSNVQLRSPSDPG